MKKAQWLSGARIDPKPIAKGIGAADLVDGAFLAYNGGRVQKAAKLFVEKMLAPEAVVGLSLTGALTPAGLGRSVIVPLIRAGFVDWIVSTGANLYHDAHFGLGLALHRGSHEVDDRVLRAEGVVRIYDILFDYEVLLKTDAYFREVMLAPEFQRDMSTAELHYLLGKYLAAREDQLRLTDTCVLTTAYRCAVPCYTSSPGDSSIGMNVAELWLKSRGPRLDVSRDVNETAAIVYDVKKSGGASGVLIFGGGSPKNFILQTEPQIQEVLGLDDAGHDYFVQVTDARADTGGLSGATPGEAVSWGKVDPEKLPGTVVIYGDTTIVAPLLAAYALTRHEPRPLRRLYDRREAMLDRLRADFVAKP
ncbi:MAG TPA: deoxyhypusine synthase [Candidatus Polarisedimenticolaceae bacterium]|nr:deoxyhypusine synthase [Candidatus Polarisedimenticolaceae bacterium]